MILPTRWPTADAMRVASPRADGDGDSSSNNNNGDAGANDGDNNNLLNRDYRSGDAVTRPTVITPPTSPSALRAQRSRLPVLNEDDTSATAEPTSPRFNRDREAPVLRARSDLLPAAHSSATPMAPRPLPTITTTITATPTTPTTTSRPTTPASSVSLGSSAPPVRRHVHSSSTTILAAAERQQRSHHQASTTREGNHHRHAPSSSVGGPSASDRLRHQQPLVQQANILPPLRREHHPQQQQQQQQQQQAGQAQAPAPAQAQAQAQAQAPPATNVSPAATAASHESAGAKKAEALAGVQSSHSGGRRPPNLVEKEMARFGDGGGAAAASGHAHHPLHHRHPSMPLLQQREHHHHQLHPQQTHLQHQHQHQLPPLQEHQQIQNLPQHQQHQRHRQQPIEHNGRRPLHRPSPSSSTIIAGRPAIAITPPTSAPVALNFQRYRRKDFSTEEEFLHQRRKASISTPFNFVHVSHTPRPQTAPQPTLEQQEPPVEETPKTVPADTTADTTNTDTQIDVTTATTTDSPGTDSLVTAAAVIAAADRSMPRKERARTRVDELRAKIHRELGVEELQPRSDLFASQSSLLFGRPLPSSTANSPASPSPSSAFPTRPPGLLRKASTPELYSSASSFYSQNVTANRVDQKMQATYIPKGYVPELPSAAMTALNIDFPAPLPERGTGRRATDAAAWPLSRAQPPRASSAAELVRYELPGAEMSPISPPDALLDRKLPPTPAPPIQVVDTSPAELPASVPVEDSDEGEVTVWPRPGGRRFSRLRLLPARLSRLTEESRSHSPVDDEDYSWETDVEFCYEHAAESTCDFDWASVKPSLRPKATAAANSSCESLHSANVPNRMPLLSTARSNSSLSARGSPSPMSDNFRGEHRRGSSVGHRGFLAARNAGTTPTTPSSVLSLDPFAYVELDAGLESPALGRNNWDMSEKQVVVPVLAPPTPIPTPITAPPPPPPAAPSQRAPRIDSANAMPGANELKTIAELPADVAIPASAAAQPAPSDYDDVSSELNSYRSAESRQSNSSLAPSSARSSKDAMTLLSDDGKGNNTVSTPRSSAGSVSAFPIPPKSPHTHVRSKSSISSAGAAPPPPPKDASPISPVDRSGMTARLTPPPIPARTIATTGKVAAAIRSFSNSANHSHSKDREIAQAAGRASPRGRPATPSRFSKLLETHTSTPTSPQSPPQASTFA